MNTTRGFSFSTLGAAFLVLLCHVPARAHDIPDEILLQAYVKPEPSQLKVVLRLPLLALGETSLPKDGTGYLALGYIEPALREAANQITNGMVLLEGSQRLLQFEVVNARISLPSDKSFDSYEGALSHLRGARIPDTTQVYYNQGFLDLELTYPIRSQSSDFAMQVLFGRGMANRTATSIQFIGPGGALRSFRLHDDTSLVRLDPRISEAAWGFLTAGFYRFLDGLDHLLFIFVLAMPYRRVRDLAPALVAFAVAHSITLIAAALGLPQSAAWFPPLIGTLVAFSIVWVAIENAVGANLHRRWITAFVFGLIHGLGFALVFGELLQFAGGHPLAALLSFNAGLELGQVIILSIAMPTLTLIFTQILSERAGIVVLSAIVAHASWHWMSDRFTLLWVSDLPVMNMAFALGVVRWLLAITIAGGAAWFLAGLLRRRPLGPDVPEKSIVDI